MATSPIKAAATAARIASRAIRGETVAYTRGANTIAITAVRGATAWDREAPYGGVRTGERSTDWIVAAADLVIGGSAITPARGDEIEADGVTFRVMPFGTESQLWAYHDRDRTCIRIHTKERA